MDWAVTMDAAAATLDGTHMRASFSEVEKLFLPICLVPKTAKIKPEVF